MLDPLFESLRDVHDRYARVILAGIATLLLPLMALTTVATLDNWRQDRERDDLLVCFDRFAGLSSSSSQAVRDASVKKDIATAERDDALNAEGVAFLRLSRQILNEDVTRDAFQDLVKTLEARKEASVKLDAAQDALDQAREDNPVPSPPSTFCSVKP